MWVGKRNIIQSPDIFCGGHVKFAIGAAMGAVPFALVRCPIRHPFPACSWPIGQGSHAHSGFAIKWRALIIKIEVLGDVELCGRMSRGPIEAVIPKIGGLPDLM